jgi:intracellular sulfur oxidation DsrE/DsrF family protein
MKQYHALFHLDEDTPEKFTETLNNIRNLLTDLGANNVEIELVANGRGVFSLLSSNQAQAIRVRNLAQEGVTFAVCANSLKYLKIDPTELMPPATIVPAGVGELVRKQAEGWAYIKP